MKRLLALALATTLIVAPSALAQGKNTAPPTTGPDKSKPAVTPAKPAEKPKETPQKADEMAKTVDEAAKPGSNHRMLEWFEGEWAAETSRPGQEKTDKGTLTCKMVYGGRFLTLDYDGRSRGLFFRGGGMWGYNNLEKRFEQTWADSDSTAITFLSGKASPDGKVFTLSGECADPNSGKRAPMKAVTTITGKDSWKDEFFAVEGGKEAKVMEISYTRVKSEKPDKPEKAEKPAAEKPAEKPKGK